MHGPDEGEGKWRWLAGDPSFEDDGRGGSRACGEVGGGGKWAASHLACYLWCGDLIHHDRWRGCGGERGQDVEGERAEVWRMGGRGGKGKGEDGEGRTVLCKWHYGVHGGDNIRRHEQRHTCGNKYVLTHP